MSETSEIKTATEWLECTMELLGENANDVILMNMALVDARADVMDILVAHGFNIHEKDTNGETYMHLAAAGGLVEAMKWLLDNGADINVKCYNGLTPMHRAAMGGNVDIIKYLQERGADLYAIDNDGRSPMDSAVTCDRTESIKCLKGLGADVNAKDNKGRTPMFTAAVGDGKSSKIACMVCLEELGADVNARDNERTTPIYWAVMIGDIEAIKCLVGLGANVNAKDNEGLTPLMVAALKGSLECLECLVELGADVTARHNNENTAIDAAIKAGHSKAAEWLRANREKQEINGDHKSANKKVTEKQETPHTEQSSVVVIPKKFANARFEKEKSDLQEKIRAIKYDNRMLESSLKTAPDKAFEELRIVKKLLQDAEERKDRELRRILNYGDEEFANAGSMDGNELIRLAATNPRFQTYMLKKGEIITQFQKEFRAAETRAAKAEDLVPSIQKKITENNRNLGTYNSQLRDLEAILRKSEEQRAEECYQQLLIKKEAISEPKVVIYELLKLAEEFQEMEGYKDTAVLQYYYLVEAKSKASTEKEYQDIAEQFRGMNGYKNTVELANECDKRYREFGEKREQERLQEAKAKEERERQEAMEREKKLTIENKKDTSWAIFSSVVGGIIGGLCFFTINGDENTLLWYILISILLGIGFVILRFALDVGLDGEEKFLVGCGAGCGTGIVLCICHFVTLMTLTSSNTIAIVAIGIIVGALSGFVLRFLCFKD